MRRTSISILLAFAIFGVSAGVAQSDALEDFMAKFPSSMQKIEVAICKTDDVGCDSPFAREILKQKEQRVDPVCQIDPCACRECEQATADKLFESLETPTLDRVQELGRTRMLGANPIQRSLAPVFDGAFKPEEQSLPSDAPNAFIATREDLSAGMAHDKRDQLLCNAATDRPAEYWRELIVRRDSLLECSKAAEVALERRNEATQEWLSVLGRSPGYQDRQVTLQIFETYKKACLHPLSQVNESYPVTATFGKDFVAKAKAQIGELNFAGKPIHCTAAIARRADGEKGLVTAAHCIGDPTLGAGQNRFQYGSVHRDMKFTSFLGKSYKVSIDPSVRGYVYDRTADVVFVPLNKEAAADVPEGFEIGPAPELWDPLYIVAVNPFLGALAQATKPDDNSLANSASVSLETGCRVYGINGQSLLHNCQTEKSMSGSPALVSRNGQVRLIGVVSGEAESTTIPECPGTSAKAANLITLISP